MTEPLETISETIASATEAVINVSDTVAVVSISPVQFDLILEYLNYLAAFGLFFAVVLLCYFGYKFLRIFF